MRKNIRHEIVQATIALIREQIARDGSVQENAVTIRQICARVGVGTGLIHYHFGTKEALFAICVRQIVGEAIDQFEGLPDGIGKMPPPQKLRLTVKATCDYLAVYGNLWRCSILTDMLNAAPQDNTSKTMAAYFPLVRDACGMGTDESAALFKTYLLVLSLQSMFLRESLVIRELGLNFADKQQRDTLIDAIIDAVL